MKKLVLVGILLMLVATFFVFTNNDNLAPSSQVTPAKKQELIALAKQSFQKAKTKGQNMENGPCLGMIAIGWVADVAHNPRLPIDDKVENQCPDYINKTAKNFIELDTNGQFIKTN